MKEFVDGLYGADFIPETEFLDKNKDSSGTLIERAKQGTKISTLEPNAQDGGVDMQSNNKEGDISQQQGTDGGNEQHRNKKAGRAHESAKHKNTEQEDSDPHANEMVGFVSDIQKKRQLSIDDTDYTKKDQEETDMEEEEQAGNKERTPASEQKTSGSRKETAPGKWADTVQNLTNTKKNQVTTDKADKNKSNNEREKPHEVDETTKTTETVTLDYSDETQDMEKNAEVQNARTKAEVHAALKTRGDQMIETKNKFVTTTKIEFNLAAETTQFSVRQATTKILMKLQAIV
jgi:hypothetical protein